MEDEVASSITIQGAVWGGAKAMTVTSGPGFSLMMEHLGEPAAATRIMSALRAVTGEGRVRTPDLGGKNTTGDFTAAVIARLAA